VNSERIHTIRIHYCQTRFIIIRRT